MGKKNSLISAFVDTNLLKKEQEHPQEQVEEQTPAKRRKVKGFYISPENEIRLVDIKRLLLVHGQPKSESEIINSAIECYFEKLKSELQKD